MILLLAFVASWAACFAVGFIGGLYLDHRPRSVPDLHVLRIHYDDPPKRWRVIEGGLQRPTQLFDWQRDDEGRIG